MNAPQESITVECDVTAAQLCDWVSQLSIADLCEALGDKRDGYPGRVGYYQYTHSGDIFFPCDPRPEEVFIKDLARGVSSVYRFNGQTKTRMTVAEHLWLCSHKGPRRTALERLMHDTPEGLIGDFIRPLKNLPILGDIYKKLEHGIMSAIATRYNILYPFPPDVRFADEATALREVQDNILSTAPHIHFDLKAEADDQPLRYWSPDVAEEIFLTRFYTLARERGLSGNL